MAVFRIEKTKDYTVMANHHLKNRELSLKAKGLLSLMLSLPDDWDYTLKGLAYISKEGVDAIREGIRELEKAGYMIRNRTRNKDGQLAGAEYLIYELPQPKVENTTQVGAVLPISVQSATLENFPESEEPIWDEPARHSPVLDEPAQEHLMLENPTQLNTKVLNTDTENKDAITIHPSIHQITDPEKMDIDRCRCRVKERIGYYDLLEDPNESSRQIDELVELIVEVLCSTKRSFRISGDDQPAHVVKERFSKLTDSHILYVTECLRKNNTRIHNMKGYLQAALFNAPTTIDHYYHAEFNHFYHRGVYEQ